MTNHIGFHVWYQIFDEYSQEQQNLIVDYIKEICALSEKDINLRGGIAGKKIKIYIDIVEPKNANKNHFLSYLEDNKDIHFLFVIFLPCSSVKGSSVISDEIIIE